ncbi:MAG: hypothetical protein K2N64_00310 [Anaeroplasmataceae bacterium]|nr:hypothetical protein [Anaeroplasmataceae bacterium]
MNKLRLGFEILNILHKNSFDAYIVGGAVRDFVRNAPIEDVDIATNALPEEVFKLFPKVTYEGKPYLSCRIHFKGCIFEVTTFRKELTYIDHRHPEYVPAQTIEEDLVRRDFTMNALAMKHPDQIIDLYHGIEDIKQGILRMIGDPVVRFDEDALRVFRALDFVSRWNYKLEQNILDSFSKDYLKYLKEELVISMIKRIATNPFLIGLAYIKEYQLLRSFPFYQVVCEEAYAQGYTKNIFALFYVIHNFLPADCKLTKQEKTNAKDIAFWIRHQFDNISLYYGKLDCLNEAIDLYNHLYDKTMSYEEIVLKRQKLPIHSSKDIQLDWSRVPTKERGKQTKRLEMAILLGIIKNREKEVIQFLETEE